MSDSSRRLRILFHSMYFYPEVGGMENHVLYLAQALSERGNEVTVVTSRSKRDSARCETILNVKVLRTPFFFKSYVGWILTVLFSLPRFLRQARESDIIHCQGFASMYAGVIVRRRKPLVVTIHSSHFIHFAERERYHPILRWALKRCDHVFAASRELAELTRRIVPDRPVVPLTNAVDIRRFHPREPHRRARGDRPFTLLCPRRLVWKNGVEIMIRALGRIEWEYRAEIVGDGPLRRDLEGLVRELGLSDRIHFLGTRPNEEIPRYIHEADVIVIPSFLEATSIAALEAMACGKVVVASDTGGLPEIVRERWGYLFRTGDPEDLARKLDQAFQERDRFQEMGAEAAGFVGENFSTERQCDIHEETYHRLLGIAGDLDP